ncbi:hypothetical protein A7985_06560 [Pseudoalteromonas luteoviolacea]|uniref:Flagellar M-ring N-terminal domain-containing protein n=1 Tax=Pseudoalteromonas luteoviolacea TaxID=43657 RepID=A0A1C0TWB5_9GAMM|nr:hypothetical protein [Pseudoalteromonas luteoviolacea]OCQ23600.1 hypothetical protein A7985_06560 [Pseudoalteromonas luteoviolacea]
MANIKWTQRTLTHKDAILYAVLTCSAMLITATIIWVKTPNFRPLIDDLRLVDAVKIADVLDMHKIAYYADVKSHMLYIDEQHTQNARLALTRAGFVIEYPKHASFSALPKACAELESQFGQTAKIPIWQQSWFMSVLRLIMGTLIIIIFIVAVVRPALRALIYGTVPNEQHK